MNSHFRVRKDRGRGDPLGVTSGQKESGKQIQSREPISCWYMLGTWGFSMSTVKLVVALLRLCCHFKE